MNTRGSRFTSEQLDAAITDVAREMTSRAPSNDIRARVLDRLDRIEARRPWHGGWMRVAMACGVLVIGAASWAEWMPRSHARACAIGDGNQHPCNSTNDRG